MAEKGPLLSVRNLSVRFGQTEAVRDLSFELHAGKTLGIVGESGSGKSVTALSLLRLIAAPGKVTQGELRYQPEGKKARNLLALPEAEMRSIRGRAISMIFQEPMSSLNPVYTCGDQVIEAIRLHLNFSRKEARIRTLELFKQVELPRPGQMLDAYPHELSGGQLQRVMIAMAMACEPAVLIADEPTTALDVTVQRRILELMRELQQKHGTAIIFITHDLGVVAELADSVLVMRAGQKVEYGSVLDIFAQPQHPYTQGLMACRPPLDRRVYRLPTVQQFLRLADDPFALREHLDSQLQLEAPRLPEPQELPLLEVENLRTWFPKRVGFWGIKNQYIRAVDDVSFKVYPGETLGLVGESGSGKTTLGRSILRLVEPTEGDILYEGKSLRGLGARALRAVRKDLQIIFQDPYSSLNPRMTIGESIREPMRVHGLHAGQQREKVGELLDKVGLSSDHYNRYPHQFSGGQRQRICIARALAVEPRFIICDESVSALDVSIQAQVLNLLKSLQEEFGFTYIFISHDLSVVRFVSDRIIVMRNGRIVEMGPATAIYEYPQSDYTQSLIDAVPRGSLEAIRERIKQ